MRGPGTITKCLSLGHFESFPQVDVRGLRWHFIHPLIIFGNRGRLTACVVGASAVGPEMAATKWHL
jgi:hypothetical protein